MHSWQKGRNLIIGINNNTILIKCIDYDIVYLLYQECKYVNIIN